MSIAFRAFPQLCRHYRHNCQITFFRRILSASYSCELEWEKRLQNELLKKISPEAFFTELSQRYIRKIKVSAIDVDMFVNVCSNEEQLEEVQHLLYKLRRTRRTKDTLDSTHHATCRLFLKFTAADRLMEIITDRIGYGIFPDKFAYNMIMDFFIEKKNFKDAAKTASLMMFQEDHGSEVSKILALYSTHMHFNDKQRVKEDIQDEQNVDKKEEEEEEVQYVRVPYIRNPYFDDHFDLTNPNHILGKTLFFFGKQFDDLAGRSYQIIGLSLYEKWQKAIDLVQKFSSYEKVCVEETLLKVDEIISSLNENDQNKSIAIELSNLLRKIKEERKVSEENLHSLVNSKLENIKSLEENDMKEMSLLFLDWNELREKALARQMEELLREEKKKEMEAKKRSLETRERLLFFFENFSKHEMDFKEAEEKIKELQASTQVEEEYIPPEL